MRIIFLAALAALALPAAASAQTPAGTWQNPKGNVRVQFRACGSGGTICGRVIWASADAQAKTNAAGGGRLVGSDLFQGFVPAGRNQWAGSVLIPDIGQSVQGTITQTGPRTLVGAGCLFGTFGCREQVWTRVK